MTYYEIIVKQQKEIRKLKIKYYVLCIMLLILIVLEVIRND